MHLAYWIHDWSPFLIQFTERFGIRYYGLAYLLGFLAAVWLLHAYAKAGRSRLARAQIADLMIALVLGVLVGGRMGYFLFYEWAAVQANPWMLLRVWEGGMASHGGFIGVGVALWWFARSRHLSFFHLSDLVASTTAIGLLLGRIANFINGELWGKPTLVAWAVIFSNTGGGPDPRHPSQLYQAALEGALLLAYIQWRFWRSRIVELQPGRLTGEFLLGYAVLRVVGEFFREPDAALILGLSRGTFYSVFMVLFGLWLIRRQSVPLPTVARG
jgi:phosphatidylglycerol:prolipoprotein diacylglycerol transferase